MNMVTDADRVQKIGIVLFGVFMVCVNPSECAVVGYGHLHKWFGAGCFDGENTVFPYTITYNLE